MAFEYTTTSLVQAELQSSTAFSSSTIPTDTTVTNWIQEESAYINSLADTVFGTSSVTEYIDYDLGDTLVLEYGPVVSVTQVRYNKNKLGATAGEDWEVKTADTHYTLYSDVGHLKILDKWVPKTGLKRIEATYVYGYSSTPLDIQMLATKLVTQRILETLISKNVNERNDGGSVSIGSISIIEPEGYGINSYKQLKADIDELKMNIVENFKVSRRGFHLYI